MKIEKYNISIEREFLRVNSKNKLLKNSFPKIFGDKEKNNFITADKEDTILKIRVPKSNSINEAYDKFVEITHVVIEELYKMNESIWPLSRYTLKGEDINLHAKICISIDNEFYDEMKEITPTLPKTLEEAYEK